MRVWLVFAAWSAMNLGLAAQSLVPATEDMRRNLAEASKTQTLESEGTPAFRLEAKFETFDYLGKPDGDGTLVEEWLRPGVQRRVITFRGLTWTQVSRDGHVRSSGNSFEGSFMEHRVIDALLMPGPSPKQLNEVTASYKPLKAGTIQLDCVILAPVDVVAKSDRADKLPSAYCVSLRGCYEVASWMSLFVMRMAKAMKCMPLRVLGSLS